MWSSSSLRSMRTCSDPVDRVHIVSEMNVNVNVCVCVCRVFKIIHKLVGGNLIISHKHDGTVITKAVRMLAMLDQLPFQTAIATEERADLIVACALVETNVAGGQYNANGGFFRENAAGILRVAEQMQRTILDQSRESRQLTSQSQSQSQSQPPNHQQWWWCW
jgi:hypothetical protein